MAYYRLYVRRDSLGGPIVAVEDFHAADDDEAQNIASQHHGDYLELWQQGRRVTSFHASRQQA